MILSAPALGLLFINLGLIWLLLAAPIGTRTIRMRREFRVEPSRIWDIVHPLGAQATWYPQVIASEREADTGHVVQLYAHSDRKGQPIRRVLDVETHEDGQARGFHSRIIEDSALDSAFWANFHEHRRVAAAPTGTELVVEVTDRYRGFAFFLFRFFALRRELLALDRWVQTGKVARTGLFEHPATQTLMAVFSTLLLWPFFGLNLHGLILSSMLTIVIALHELGHLAAYRAFGHHTVRMIFIPFLGGVAIGSRPYNTLFEVAACALMGAGLSAFLVPVAIAIQTSAETGAIPAGLGGPTLTFLLVMSAFNLLNLLPMSRFDGGQVLRQVFPTRDGLLGGSFLVTAAILAIGWRIGIPSQALYGGLAVMALLSFTNQGSVKPRDALDPMSGGERLFAGFGYYAALAIHGYGLVFAADRLF